MAHARGRSVLDLMAEMDAVEWAGWRAFADLEPFGPLRDDLRAASVASITAASNGLRVRPDEVFASLNAPRPRGRGVAGRPPVSSCPGLRAVPVD